MQGQEEDLNVYYVVINEEEQHSIWPENLSIPKGWKSLGFKGNKETCLAHIKEVWKDMRPLSLRNKMRTHQQEIQKQKVLIDHSSPQTDYINPTVEFLTKGKHPVTTLPTNKSLKELEDALLRDYVHIHFTDTKGGTCLGIKVNKSKTNYHQEDFINGKGVLHIEGTLKLDYVPLHCIADIDLSSLKGTGYLQRIEEKI